MVELRGLSESARKKLRTGQKVEAVGDKIAELRLDNSSVTVLEQAPVEAAVTGTKRVLTIVANYADKQVACSNAQIAATMYGATNSVDAIFRETRLGQFGITGAVTAPVSINVRSTDQCDSNSVFQWAGLADEAAKRAGYNLGAYDSFMYVFPVGSCWFAGIAYVPGNKAINTGYCENGEVYAHELGHNLGMYHASQGNITYGDYSDVMGNGGLYGLNAPHKIQMGWIDPAQVVTVNQSGSFRLAPLVLDRASAGAPQVVKVQRDATQAYYISYRQPIGYDAKVYPQYHTGVSVHTWAGGNTNVQSVLSDTGTFTDSTLGMIIRQVSHDSSGVNFELSMGGVTPSPSPTVSPSPTSTPTPSPSPSPTPSPTPSPSPTPTSAPDTQAPSVSLTHPAAGTMLARRSVVSLAASASDNVGVQYVQFLVNGQVVCSDTSAPYGCSWKVPGKRGGSYSFEAVAADAAGNVGRSGSRVLLSQ